MLKSIPYQLRYQNKFSCFYLNFFNNNLNIQLFLVEINTSIMNGSNDD